jgi:nucleoside-diphosphate-sugar epimerase
MRVLVTGAGGFVGRRLVRRLLAEEGQLNQPIARLALLDTRLDEPLAEPRVEAYVGSITDVGLLRQALASGVDVVFHLASVPGGLAERDYELGRQVNLDATLTLLEHLREQPHPPVVVFASSIAVFGNPMPALVDNATLPRPQLSYGAHKLIGEVLVSDFSRRAWIDGVSLRLPGIVARPPEPSGLLSAFMSDIFWRLAAGEPFICPVSPQAVAWWMSVECCVHNLLHAARLSPAQRATARVVTLPILRLTIAELVDGLARRYGEDRRGLVRYEPDEALEAGFGRYPPLDVRSAEALGFRHDRNVERLIANAVTPH